MYPSTQYRIAAQVLESEKPPGYIEMVADLTEKAALAKKQELYIANLARVFDPTQSYHSNGSLVVNALIEDGWTPPEGLF